MGIGKNWEFEEGLTLNRSWEYATETTKITANKLRQLLDGVSSEESD